MTVSEFKRLTDKPFTEEEFEKIHFVYENYPGVTTQADIALIWAIGGIDLINDMLQRAYKGASSHDDSDEEIDRLKQALHIALRKLDCASHIINLCDGKNCGDGCDKMRKINQKVLFLCDKTKCDTCEFKTGGTECKYTSDIKHAKNFVECCGSHFEVDSKSNASIKFFYGRYSEAKPCPFCGGTEILVFSELSGSDIEIACAKCGAKVRFPGVRSRKEAIKIWSRRTNNA